MSPKLQNSHLGPGRIQHGGLDIQIKTKNGTDGSRTADLLEKRLEYLGKGLNLIDGRRKTSNFNNYCYSLVFVQHSTLYISRFFIIKTSDKKNFTIKQHNFQDNYSIYHGLKNRFQLKTNVYFILNVYNIRINFEFYKNILKSKNRYY